MSGATNYMEAKMLNDALNVSGNYVGLFTTKPTADDGSGGVEVTGGSYARVGIASNDWAAASQGAPSSKAGPSGSGTNPSWQFPSPSAGWGTVVAWGIWDAASGGNLLFFGDLSASKTINASDPQPVFNSTHQIVIQLGDSTDTFG